MVTVNLQTQPGRKQKIWQDAITWHFGPAELSIREPERFVGQISSFCSGSIKLAHVKSDNEIGIRTRQHLSGVRDEFFTISFVNRGKVEFQQRNRACVLSEGMLTIFEVSEPYLMRHDDPAEVISLTMPAILLRSFLRHPHDRVCRAITSHGIIGKVSRDLLMGLADSAASDGSHVSHASLQLALGSVSVLIEGSEIATSGVSGHRSAMLERCKEVIDTFLAEPELGPKFLAQKMGISVRYLHSLFHALETTVCGYILSARLSKSLRILGDPDRKPVRLKEIAFDSGFTSQSKFSAQFRARYGKTPRQMREQLVGKQPK